MAVMRKWVGGGGAFFVLLAAISWCRAQVNTFPYTERFDSVTAPTLPAGWLSSTARLSSGDFVTTASSPRSAPNAAFSSNATVTQWLASPSFDFTFLTPDRLEFFAARSGTHTAPLVVEASLDGGQTFPLMLGDTLRHPGTTGYVLRSIPLPSALEGQSNVRFRWRVIGLPGSGTSGTLRLDDVSVTVLTSYDLALTRLVIVAMQVGDVSPSRQPLTLQAVVRNAGVQAAAGYAVEFFRDANGDGKAEAAERFAAKDGPVIGPLDSAVVSVEHGAVGAGDHRFFAVASFPQDENRANDTATAVVSFPAGRAALIVNEVMYDPLPGQNEWVELHNRSDAPIDIARWRISDRPTAGGSVNSFLLTTASLTVWPGDFVVVAAESTLLSLFPHLRTPPATVHLLVLNRASGLSLGNDGDEIVLKDGTGTTVDSVSYSPAWHHPGVAVTKGRSLERINPGIDSNDPRNWSTSAVSAGGTPGGPNSIFTPSQPTAARLTISPNPFSPDGDGFEDFCMIAFTLPHATPIVRIAIFDLRGRLLRTLTHAGLSGPHGEIVWDGLDDGRQRVRVGPYIVLLEAIDGNGSTVASAKSVVVVATKL